MALLAVNDIKKDFGKTEVLKGISFGLEKGEVLAIIGSSGSGKTTLLRCLNFLELPDQGTITVDGKLLFDGSDEATLSDEAAAHYQVDGFRKQIIRFIGGFTGAGPFDSCQNFFVISGGRIFH
ncbi:MAG: amino acid ABC transporter ATP-binding protein, partial [Oscillospiraceae bacterium]|nr:amino acid ABC transporter ATP-binding protein [Oscillospiraceae bacterium]